MLADTSPESPSLYRIIKPVSGFCFSFFTAPPFFFGLTKSEVLRDQLVARVGFR
jgi:hypothetical protein